MKQKKKGNKKARRKEAETAKKEVDAPSKEVKTPSIQEVYSGKEVETPSEGVKTPNIPVVTPSKEVEEPNKEVKTPSVREATVKEVVIPSKEEKTLEEVNVSKEVKIPSKEVKIPSKEVKSPCIKEVNPSKEVEALGNGAKIPSIKAPPTPSIEEKMPSQEAITIIVETNTPSIDQNCTTKPSIDVLTPIKAIEEIPEDIKHPLENKWGFWLFTNENKKNWAENLKQLTEFDTVEDYWCLYHHMKLPSELKLGMDYAVFKYGIQPMWEDPANKVGGRWCINLDRKADTDRIWLDVTLLMIGENFESSDIICGAVVNIKAKNRISIWTRIKNEAANMKIGKKLKEMLRISFKLQYLDHKNNSPLYVL